MPWSTTLIQNVHVWRRRKNLLWARICWQNSNYNCKGQRDLPQCQHKLKTLHSYRKTPNGSSFRKELCTWVENVVWYEMIIKILLHTATAFVTSIHFNNNRQEKKKCKLCGRATKSAVTSARYAGKSVWVHFPTLISSENFFSLFGSCFNWNKQIEQRKNKFVTLAYVVVS